jgi:hypothetical protein
MDQQDLTQNAIPVRGGVESIGYNHGDSMPAPKPSSAAVSAGAVGPGALAAAETSLETSQDSEAASGLTSEEIENLRSLAQRLGGVDALIRWFQVHPDLR